MDNLTSELKAALTKIEYLKQHLEHPIESTTNGIQVTFSCKYCGQNLGTKIATTTQHVKDCAVIPANKVNQITGE